MFLLNANEIFDFEMQRTNSCLKKKSSSVWTQIIWTFDIKLAEISANMSLFFCVCFCFVKFDLEEMKYSSFWPQFEIKTVCRLMSNCGEMGDHFVSSKFEFDV